MACSPLFSEPLSWRRNFVTCEKFQSQEGLLLSVIMREYLCSVTIFIRCSAGSGGATTRRRMKVFSFLWLIIHAL